MSHRDSFIKKNIQLKKPIDIFNVGFIGNIAIPPFTAPVASGGTVTTSGNYKIHTFTTSSSFVITSLGTPTNSFDVIVVGGGGNGGSSGGSGTRGAGGGGGGGMREATLTNLTTGSKTVTVGASRGTSSFDETIIAYAGSNGGNGSVGARGLGGSSGGGVGGIGYGNAGAPVDLIYSGGGGSTASAGIGRSGGYSRTNWGGQFGGGGAGGGNRGGSGGSADAGINYYQSHGGAGGFGCVGCISTLLRGVNAGGYGGGGGGGGGGGYYAGGGSGGAGYQGIVIIRYLYLNT